MLSDKYGCLLINFFYQRDLISSCLLTFEVPLYSYSELEHEIYTFCVFVVFICYSIWLVNVLKTKLNFLNSLYFAYNLYQITPCAFIYLSDQIIPYFVFTLYSIPCSIISSLNNIPTHKSDTLQLFASHVQHHKAISEAITVINLGISTSPLHLSRCHKARPLNSATGTGWKFPQTESGE